LENREGKDDKMFGGVWKAVETKARKGRIVEAERGRNKEGSRKEARR